VKWILTCLVAVIIVAVGWITLQDFRSLDPRSAVNRATVVAYGHVVVSASRPHVVIDEIWKSSASSRAVAIGTVVPFPAPAGAADHVLVCFTPQLLSRRLSPSAIFAIRGDRVGSPSISLSEVKALCNAPPRT
jgi:hypothetical protein